MKKNSYIGISLVILISGIIFIPMIHERIVEGGITDNNRSLKVIDDIKTNKELRQDTLATLNRIPPFRFVNQNNDTITNEDYAGKVYIVEFFFTTCGDICPIMNRNMVKIQNEFYGNPNLGIASFSIDPTYDTPEILKEYVTNYGITNPNWHLLTGDKVEIFKLSNEGFKIYAAQSMEDDRSFEHSGLFALIDQEGNIRSRYDENNNPIIYYDGLESEGIQMLIEDIEKLL
jgi:protein SCO1/2